MSTNVFKTIRKTCPHSSEQERANLEAKHQHLPNVCGLQSNSETTAETSKKNQPYRAARETTCNAAGGPGGPRDGVDVKRA